MIHIYKAFGLRFASEIPCPEFTSDCGKADVLINIGRIPNKYLENEDWAYFWSASPLHFYLTLKNIGRFHCEEGSTITVEPAPGHDPIQLRVFLFGSVFGALMHQREIFPLHASAVERDGVAIAFTGDSGAGKSTLASACLENGFRLISDDVCAITKSPDNTPEVHPSYPLLKISQEMIERINLRNASYLPPALGSSKHRLSPPQFSTTSSQLRSVFVLSKNAESNSPLEISKLTGVKKIQALLKNIYRYEYIRPMQKEKKVFEHCTFLAQHISVFSINGGHRHLHPCSIIHKIEMLSLYP